MLHSVKLAALHSMDHDLTQLNHLYMQNGGYVVCMCVLKTTSNQDFARQERKTSRVFLTASWQCAVVGITRTAQF